MALFSRRQERDTDQAAAPELPAAGEALRSGPVSRPVAMVTGPSPVVDLPDRLLHTATPRYLAVLGVAGTLIVGVAGTLTSFTADGLRDMRPQLTEAFVIALGVAAFGGLWWSTFATMNGRRVTRGRTVGPILPTFVYVAIAVAYLVVNANVHGEARAWAWVAWSLVVFAAHSFVIIAFKSSAETIGNPTTHFTQVAIIPIAMAAAVSVGVGVGVLQGIPFLAVPLLMAWLVFELFRAMQGWDRACAQRMKVMLRDFSYDTPSGSVPVTAPTNTGQTPATTPRTQVMQVTTTEPPARVEGTHHPQRPVWNPVEEARLKAEAQAAAMMTGGVVDAQAAAGAGGATPHRVQRPRRRHHTLIPRLMISAEPILLLGGAAIVLMLVQTDHLKFDLLNDDELNNGKISLGRLFVRADLAYDTTARSILVWLVVLWQAVPLIGRLWWSTAALANARQRSGTAPSPGLVAACGWAVVTSVVLVVIGLGKDVRALVVVGLLIGFVAVVYGFFGVLGALRTAAGIVGAPREPWSALIRFPFIAFAVNVAAGLITRAISESVRPAVTLILILLIQLWSGYLSIRAAWSFDQASQRPPAPKVDEAHVPLFMRQAAGIR